MFDSSGFVGRIGGEKHAKEKGIHGGSRNGKVSKATKWRAPTLAVAPNTPPRPTNTANLSANGFVPTETARSGFD
jgi:hypothetical protein